MTRCAILLLLLIGLFPHGAIAQKNDDIFDRLQAIRNGNNVFYNVDGQEISSREVDLEFNSKNIAKSFRHLKFKEKDLVKSDSDLEFPNYYISKDGEYQNFLSYYFVESKSNGIIGFTFASPIKPDQNFERNFIRLVRNNEIPDHVFNSEKPHTINFAGREISLGSNCRWMSINNVQCPYFGQMSWSVHKTLSSAENSIQNHFDTVTKRKGGKVIADTTVSVLFEDELTDARRIVYDLTGIRSLLVGTTGGKTLTIYMVATPVRDNFVSCVMSFWNNDYINPSGLPPLLEEVMELK